MLRRKLLIRMGILVMLMALAGVGAILSMQGVLREMAHVRDVAMGDAGQAVKIGITISSIEFELTSLRRGEKQHLDDLIEEVSKLEQQIDELCDFYAIAIDGAEDCAQIKQLLPEFTRHVGALAATPDPALYLDYTGNALEASLHMRRHLASITDTLHDHMSSEQNEILGGFRLMVIGTSVVFLVLINVTILTLIRAAAMILKPVDELVEGSRRLANEEFEHRVVIEQCDEFAELAHAHNNLAEQLQLNEHHKVETLHHVAATLSHELNNATAIIEMQLALAARTSSDDPALAKPLTQIHGELEKMGKTIEALRRVRRVVLTDYVAGVKMLDLHLSVADDPAERINASTPEPGTDQ